DTTPTRLYTPSLHVALPIWGGRTPFSRDSGRGRPHRPVGLERGHPGAWPDPDREESAGDSDHEPFPGLCPGGLANPAAYRGYIGDRKSTRLNSSHVKISYAV